MTVRGYPAQFVKNTNTMNDRRTSKILILILFLAGLTILLYPTISDQWNKYRNAQLKSEYTQTIENSDRESLEEELEAASEYNKTLVGSSVPDAFSIREDQADEEYEHLLNINNDGMMGYVDIPSIDVSLPIYHYTSEEVLQKGVGHLAGSSLPVGGSSTHTVISAHRGLPSAKMFTDINLLEEGDIFKLHILDWVLAYEVDQIKVVEPDNTEDLGITEGKDYAILFTCTPYGVNTKRLLVRGYRITGDDEKITSQAASHHTVFPNLSVIMELLCVLVGILLAVFIIWILGIPKKRKRGRLSHHEKK